MLIIESLDGTRLIQFKIKAKQIIIIQGYFFVNFSATSRPFTFNKYHGLFHGSLLTQYV